MPINDYVRPRERITAIRSPSAIVTRHSAARCRKYFKRKRLFKSHPAFDRDLELKYRIRADGDGFRVLRQIGPFKNSPLGFTLTVDEVEGGAEIQLRFETPSWFFWTAGTIYVALILLALLVMDWWPCLLTLAILATAAFGALHLAAMDRVEITRFLTERFGDSEDRWFGDEEDAS